jgi:hypothetical protein
MVEVRTRDATTTRSILDSVRLVDVDHVGCPTRRPGSTAKPGAPGADTVPAQPAAVGVCFYGDWASDRLQSSTELTGGRAAQAAAAVTNASPGGNPDQPADRCLETHPPAPDLVLLVRDNAGRVTVVRITFSSCTGRAIEYGTRRAQVSQSLLRLLMEPLHTGYGFSGDLPE